MLTSVFLFNPLVSNHWGPQLSVTVNSSPNNYGLPYTLPQTGYIPLGTQAPRIPGSTPSGNSFVDNNQVQVQIDQSLPYILPMPMAQFPGDLVLYVLYDRMLLISADGLLLKVLLPLENVEFPSDRHHHHEKHGAAADTAALVYVYNLSIQDISVSSNGGSIGPIPAWGAASSNQPYQPNNQPALRVSSSSQGRGNIFNGDNQIMISTGNEQLQNCTVPVSGTQFPLNQPLFLYLLSDHWYLADQFFSQVTSGPIQKAVTGTLGNTVSKSF